LALLSNLMLRANAAYSRRVRSLITHMLHHLVNNLAQNRKQKQMQNKLLMQQNQLRIKHIF